MLFSGPSCGRGPAPCGDDLEGIPEGLVLTKRERRAVGRIAADVQRSHLVKEFEAALLAGDFASSQLPFSFRDVF